MVSSLGCRINAQWVLGLQGPSVAPPHRQFAGTLTRMFKKRFSNNWKSTSEAFGLDRPIRAFALSRLDDFLLLGLASSYFSGKR